MWVWLCGKFDFIDPAVVLFRHSLLTRTGSRKCSLSFDSKNWLIKINKIAMLISHIRRRSSEVLLSLNNFVKVFSLATRTNLIGRPSIFVFLVGLYCYFFSGFKRNSNACSGTVRVRISLQFFYICRDFVLCKLPKIKKWQVMLKSAALFNSLYIFSPNLPKKSRLGQIFFKKNKLVDYGSYSQWISLFFLFLHINYILITV